MKKIKRVIVAISLVILFGANIKIYANENNLNISKYNDIVGESYKKEKIQSNKIQKQSENNDIPKEVLDDLEGLKNIKLLELKTNYNYEIALAYEDGQYTFLDVADNIEEAIKKANNAKLNVKSDIIPTVVNKEGLVVYATQSIGRIVKIKDGQISGGNADVTNIYKTINTSNVHAEIAHEYIEDVPIIENNGIKSKIQLNGFTGYINNEDSKGVNIISVPINQAKNLSYYTKTSAGSLNHYISSDVTIEGKGNTIQIGVAPSMMEIGKKYYSYDCKYFYDNIENLINDLKDNSIARSINKNEPYYNYYTNIPMRYKNLYSVEEINQYITKYTPADSVLRNKGKAIVEAQNKYGISANTILSIAMNESSKGTSPNAKNKYNIFGLDANTNNPDNAAIFKNVEECIDVFSKDYMHNGFLNPKSWKYNGSNIGNKNFGANVRYAADPFWGEKASHYMYEMDKYISQSSSLIEYNRYQIGKFKTVDKVKDSGGNVLYDIIKERSGIWNQWAYGQVGDMIITLSQKNGQYEMYPDRQAPMDAYYPNPYEWDKTGFVNQFSIDSINMKSQNLREFKNVTVNNLNITSSTVTGKAPYGCSVKIFINGTQIGKTTTVSANETYNISIPKQKTNTDIVVEFSKDGYKTSKLSKSVLNIFDTFSVNSITAKSSYINGKGMSGATVKAYVGNNQIGNTVTVNSSGNYKIAIPLQKSNTNIVVKMNKSGYETIQKNIKVIGTTSGVTNSLTKDIYKYDAGSGKYLTYINGKGYSQYVYLNKSGNYAFTPSSWMVAAGLDVSMPTSANGYTMTIDNSYIGMYNDAKALLDKIKLSKISKVEIEAELNRLQLNVDNESVLNIEDMSNKEINILTKAVPKNTLTNDIYKYDAGSGKYLTYINGTGYSQYVYLNKSGKYAFTPSSWMKAAGLDVTMPTNTSGYIMNISNSYINKYNNIVKEIKLYL